MSSCVGSIRSLEGVCLRGEFGGHVPQLLFQAVVCALRSSESSERLPHVLLGQRAVRVEDARIDPVDAQPPAKNVYSASE